MDGFAGKVAAVTGAGSMFDKIAITGPKRAARVILKGVRKKKARILVGPDARAFSLIVRAFPSGYQRLMTPMAARFQPSPR